MTHRDAIHRYISRKTIVATRLSEGFLTKRTDLGLFTTTTAFRLFLFMSFVTTLWHPLLWQKEEIRRPRVYFVVSHS